MGNAVLRVMLIDDEPPALRRLQDMLDRIGGIEVVAAADYAEDALEVLARIQVDAIFLDVRMPGKNGFRLLSELPHRPLVVFVTAYSDYAAQAFDVEAVDYLLKPVRPARLEEAVRRVRAALQDDSDQPAYDLNDRICLRTPERTVVAPLGDLVMLEAERDFTRVTVAETAPILICQSLGTYDESLPNPPFLRVDRSLMINLNRLRSVEISPSRGAWISLEGIQKPLPLGRTALRRLRGAIPHDLSAILEK